MRCLIPSLLTASALALLVASPAQAQVPTPADDTLERLLDDGALEHAAASALAHVDLDALLLGFTQAAQATADGQPVDPGQADLLAERINRQMAAAGPPLARAAAGVLAPALQQLRAELGRELAGIERD